MSNTNASRAASFSSYRPSLLTAKASWRHTDGRHWRQASP